jgi:hypothetical protein
MHEEEKEIMVPQNKTQSSMEAVATTEVRRRREIGTTGSKHPKASTPPLNTDKYESRAGLTTFEHQPCR